MKSVLPWVLVLTAGASGQCTTAACFGPAGADPLVISGAWVVAPGASLDFGARHVILSAGATLGLLGAASISAAQLTAQPGSLIDATSSTIAEPLLAITTTPAGAHDGSATFGGMINLTGVAPAMPAGSLQLTAGGPASVAFIDTSGAPVVGSITITAPSISIGTIVAGGTSPVVPSTITLTSTGPVTVGNIQAQTLFGYNGCQIAVSASSYVQTGDIDARPQAGGWPASVAINATGSVSIQGWIRTGIDSFGGSISVVAQGNVSWTGGGAFASGDIAGSIVVQSLGFDVLFDGQLFARDTGSIYGGSITVQAAGNLDFTGTIDARNVISLGIPNAMLPQVSLIAGRTLRVHTGSVVNIEGLCCGCQNAGGPILLDGCRIIVESGATVSTCAGWNNAGGGLGADVTLSVVARDVLTVDGTLNAGLPPGQVLVTSRLALPYGIAGSGTIAPAPVVTVDPTLLPCLTQSSIVGVTSPAVAGQTIALSVTSHPFRPLLVAGDWSLAHLPLGPFGWTQLNLFTAYRIGDDLGLLGPPIAASTDASGQWSWTTVTPVTPVLSNVDVHFDVYVLDPAALNGVFEQPPHATIHFN